MVYHHRFAPPHTMASLDNLMALVVIGGFGYYMLFGPSLSDIIGQVGKGVASGASDLGKSAWDVVFYPFEKTGEAFEDLFT
jgi:hypothetical protein